MCRGCAKLLAVGHHLQDTVRTVSVLAADLWGQSVQSWRVKGEVAHSTVGIRNGSGFVQVRVSSVSVCVYACVCY